MPLTAQSIRDYLLANNWTCLPIEINGWQYRWQRPDGATFSLFEAFAEQVIQDEYNATHP